MSSFVNWDTQFRFFYFHKISVSSKANTILPHGLGFFEIQSEIQLESLYPSNRVGSSHNVDFNQVLSSSIFKFPNFDDLVLITGIIRVTDVLISLNQTMETKTSWKWRLMFLSFVKNEITTQIKCRQMFMEQISTFAIVSSCFFFFSTYFLHTQIIPWVLLDNI